MKKKSADEILSDAIGKVGDRYVLEALNYDAGTKRQKRLKKLCLTAAGVCLVVGAVLFACLNRSQSVTVYAYGSNQQIEEAGPVILSGSIDDNGEMKGHPLQFYVLGNNIESIRFSCKNENISFVDWTEQRGDYGLSKNFTVQYGEEEEEYYYLVIDWNPENIIKKLTENPDVGIADLSMEEKEDLIVMEITYLNGKSRTMAIHICLKENGQFTAELGEYQIASEDDFVQQPDSQTMEHQP